MALKIVKYVYDCSSQLISVIWFAVSVFAVSCRGPVFFYQQKQISFQQKTTVTEQSSHVERAICVAYFELCLEPSPPSKEELAPEPLKSLEKLSVGGMCYLLLIYYISFTHIIISKHL